VTTDLKKEKENNWNTGSTLQNGQVPKQKPQLIQNQRSSPKVNQNTLRENHELNCLNVDNNQS